MKEVRKEVKFLSLAKSSPCPARKILHRIAYSSIIALVLAVQSFAGWSWKSRHTFTFPCGTKHGNESYGKFKIWTIKQCERQMIDNTHHSCGYICHGWSIPLLRELRLSLSPHLTKHVRMDKFAQSSPLLDIPRRRCIYKIQKRTSKY